jgi:NlpC/P60 family/Transglycosylase SLT domain
MTATAGRKTGVSKVGIALAVLAVLGVIATPFGTITLIIMLISGAGLGSSCNTTPTVPLGPVSAYAAADIPTGILRDYQQAGQQYGIPWTILAGIGKAETDHDRSTAPGVHSGANFAGAMGPMQFLAGTWAEYGNGGNVYDPDDAIPAAARYLRASGAPSHTYRAIFAYNHADWYVQLVLGYARRYAGGADPTQTIPITAPGAMACSQPEVQAPTAAAAKVIAYAQAQLGKPYIWGGTGPTGYDCSGLTMMAYKSAGITIPRLANYQYFNEPHIPAGSEQPGDLVFFAGSDGTQTDPGHVGIVDNPTRGTMIVAPHTGTSIQYQSYKTYPGGAVGFARPSSH